MNPKRKKYTYTVTVGDYGVDDVFFVQADTFKEAAEIAKRKFIRLYWRRKELKAFMESKSENLL